MNSEGKFGCWVNFSFGCENLSPAGGHERGLPVYLHSALPPFVSVTRSTLLCGTLPLSGEVAHRRGITGTPRIYRKGVFVLLPGCRHWLRTCSAFLKSCHPCYGCRLHCRFLRPSVSSSNPGSFPRRRNHHEKGRSRDPLPHIRPPSRDRKKFLTPVVVPAIRI